MSTPLPSHVQTFYTSTTPASLATAPEWFSFSTLKSLKSCPRQWQLQNSQFPGVPCPYPQQPSPKRSAGIVIHRFLQRLLPRVASAGYPERSEPAFAELMAAFQPRQTMERLLAEELEAQRGNPRAWRESDLGVTSRELLNSAYRLLDKSYHPRTDKGMASGGAPLAEQGVRHPSLPLKGFLDLVIPRPDGDHIVDYKSGDFRPEYTEQLQIYALLWWRARGRLPARLRVILTESSTESVEIPVQEEELERLEEGLADRISRFQQSLNGGPAPARADEERCRWCPVRQACDPFWSAPETVPLRQLGGREQARLDLELGAPRLTSDHSLLARLPPSDLEIRVVTDASFGADLQHLRGAKALRLLGANVGPGGVAVLGRSSEAFVKAPRGAPC